MSDNEKIYDEEIAPLLLQAAKICEAHKMPMVASVWFDNNGDSGQTSVAPEGEHAPWLMTYGAMRSGGNIDSLCMALEKSKISHNSVVLGMLRGFNRA